ncbi:MULTISPECIES: hypothetical protein [unclassified Chryseobacterium]|uniref:hypothetical protein n=1 Tax=unclassified Chryseobacterium TaxID=2593645 RepID=UPI00285334CC|nr:hypothetical protein [Chryseobacterium sp. CFS7]MDR4891626.1 hypothetical protein [Chryseobacterium sp. CFS7]
MKDKQRRIQEKIERKGKKKQLQLFREGMEGVEKASKQLINNISKKRIVKIAQEGTDDFRYLEWMGAEANVGGEDLKHILLKNNPSKAAVLEEFLHGTQKNIKIIENTSDIAYAEYHVKDFMIRHQRLLGLIEEDIEILKILRDRDYEVYKNIK